MTTKQHVPFHNQPSNPTTCELWVEYVGGRGATCPCDRECATCAEPLGEDYGTQEECRDCRRRDAEAKVASIKAALDQVPAMYLGARLAYAEDLITLERELERINHQEN